MVDGPHIDTIFCGAIEIESAEEREVWLNQVCGEDAAMRRQVARLVEAHFRGGSVIDAPFFAIEATTHSMPPESLGTQIGPYKLLQIIGEGGMGVVYMAEQMEPVKRKVALKLIKPGMDSRQVIARFEAERQALALMDHPNIARVLDAGTTASGQPFFAMELVRGIPITDYCDTHRLSVSRRIEIMMVVCQAVQHAHQKGIIHRDLKPSNVLVPEYDGQPVPKIIDFGVAKATSEPLTAKTMFTAFGQLIGTFQYMSPEQARFNQLDVDTRSDVYSLGVLFYELLTGSTPLDKAFLKTAALNEILQIINEEEPLLPSTRLSSSPTFHALATNRSLEPKKLAGLLSGELDCIVMKCLEKERGKRYGTAEQVADELRRFLAGEPILARSITMSQRMWRWYCRNVQIVAGAYTVVIFALFGVTYVVIFCIQFLIYSPSVSDLMSGLAPILLATFVCLSGIEIGIAAFRGKVRGLCMSLIAFVLYGAAGCWALYWAIRISRELSDVPLFSFQAFAVDTLAGKNAFIRNCVIDYVLLALTGCLIGVGLQVHALYSRATRRILNVLSTKLTGV